MLATLIACGNDDTTVPKDSTVQRKTRRDAVPLDLEFKRENVTFFVRDDQELWKHEIDVEKTTNDTLYDAIYYRKSDEISFLTK